MQLIRGIGTQQHDGMPYFETSQASGDHPPTTRDAFAGKYPSTLVTSVVFMFMLADKKITEVYW